jgi:hypothetical protein
MHSFYDVTTCSLVIYQRFGGMFLESYRPTLKMEAVRSSEALVEIHHNTRRNISEDNNLYCYHRVNVKSHK